MNSLITKKKIKKNIVLAFAGKIGSGKTVMAKLFEIRYPKIKRISYSSQISRVAGAIWGEKMKKNRKLLQKIGQISQYTTPHLWDKLIHDEMVKLKINSYIIDGLRYESNFKWCEKNNIPIFYFDIENDIRHKNIKKRGALMDLKCLDHPGELAIERCKSYATWIYKSDCITPPYEIVDKILDSFGVDAKQRVKWDKLKVDTLFNS